LDNEQEAEANRASPNLWTFATDSQKGTQMIVYFKFNWATMQPEARPVAAADLFRDESHEAVASVDVKALERLGLRPELLAGVLTDGTDHAVQEGKAVVEIMHAKAQAVPNATVHQKSRKAIREWCCIHGWALEEKCGMEAAFPYEYLVNALRLLWEMVSSPETGQTTYYREVWG